MGRPCWVCSNRERADKVAELVYRGLSDRAIADVLNAERPPDRPRVSRRRSAGIADCIMSRQSRTGSLFWTKNAHARAAREERQRLVEAAAADTFTTEQLIEATIGVRALMVEVSDITIGLKRMATVAEAAQSPRDYAAVSGQRLRGVEVGAKIGGHLIDQPVGEHTDFP